MDDKSLEEEIEELEAADPANAVDAAERVADHREKVLEREEEDPTAPPP